MANFLTLAELDERIDSRITDQLSADDDSGVRVDDNVTAAIADASSEIRMACMQGGVYTATQLDDLVVTGDTALLMLCAPLTIRNLNNRRSMGLDPSLEKQIERAEELLEQLKNGSRILNIDNALTADDPEIQTISADDADNLLQMTPTSFFGGGKATRTTNG